MNACINHRENAAIEHCEVCDKPLCGLCLWYTEDGHRLCEEHAKIAEFSEGAAITPPSAYAEAIENSLQKMEDLPEDATYRPGVYKGNQTDVAGLLALVSGVATMAMCSGVGVYCMPFIALGLGFYAYSNAKHAVDAKRTQNMAMLGIGAGGLIVLLIVGFFLFYFFLIMLAIFASGTP